MINLREENASNMIDIKRKFCYIEFDMAMKKGKIKVKVIFVS